MRRFLVLAVLPLAGCEVASRNVTEFEFLGQVEALIDAKDRCGLYRLVSTRPGALAGGDDLAVELRDFVNTSRGACRLGTSGSDDGGSAWSPDVNLVTAARSERSGARSAQGGVSPPLSSDRPSGSHAVGREQSPSVPSSATGGGPAEQAADGPGSSPPREPAGGARQQSDRPHSVSPRDEPQRDTERGRQGGPERGRQEKEERGSRGRPDERQNGGGNGRGREQQR
jgi:hypothetical protein